MDDVPSLKENTLYKTDKGTKVIYGLLFALNLGIFIAGILLGSLMDVVMSVPIMMILLATLVYDSKFVHIPPILFTIVNAAMIISLIARALEEYHPMVDVVIYIFVGASLGAIGIIISYMSLGRMPGFAREKPLPIIIESICVGIALYVMWILGAYYITELVDSDIERMSLDVINGRMLSVIVGASLITLYFFSSNGPLRKGIEGFLGRNSKTIGIDTDEKEELLALIAEGESFDLEFKSTIRLNLKTGEKDKRMEKAVLKSLVAFLNGDGGTLLVGVADDGSILGVDVEGFDNCDKMNLHIINLISSQIGDEFLPFIRFREINFGKKESGADKLVVRFDCRPTITPAFYREGKTETFFVRSGPSSVELTGSDLIKYIDNRRKSVKRKYPVARGLSQTQSQPEEAESEE